MGFYVLAISSGILSGIWAFGLGVYRAQLTVVSVLLVSSAAAFTVYAVAGASSGHFTWNLQAVGYGALGGVLNLAGNAMLVLAFRRGKVGVAGGVGKAAVLVPLGYSLATGVAFTTSTAVGVAIVIAGLVGFYFPDRTARRADAASGPALLNVPVLLALAGALFWGTAVLVLTRGSRAGVAESLLVQQGVQLTVLLGIVIFSARKHLTPLTRRSVGVLAGAGAALGLGRLAYYTAAQVRSVSLVAVLSSLGPLVAALLAFLFLQETLTRRESAALAAVVVGTCVIVGATAITGPAG